LSRLTLPINFGRQYSNRDFGIRPSAHLGSEC
jgi:hypothetical protein